MISCADAVRQMWEYVEQELDSGDRENVDEHLDRCRRCCGEMEFAEQLQRFMARGPEVDLPPGISAKFEKVLQDLETEGAS